MTATALPVQPAQAKPRGLSESEQAALVRDMRRAGAEDDALAKLRAEIVAATPADLPRLREVIGKVRDRHLRGYYVAGPGVVMLDGRAHEPGRKVRLTPAEAAELGSVVREGEPPPPPVPAAKRTAGRYRVLSGSVTLGGRCYGPETRWGDVVELGQADARSLGTADIVRIGDAGETARIGA